MTARNRTRLLMRVTLFIILGIVFNENTQAQIAPPSTAFSPQNYLCYTALDSLTIDGKLDEESWEQAPWTEDFLDIEGRSRPEPRYRTRAKMLWDNTYFYIAARMEEPHVWATLTQRDTVIFYDNDFEVFIDPDGDTHHYYELEVNAFGTEWDLLLTQPYRDGGKAIDSWDIQGLEVGIGIEGTLNNPADIDSGWTVEIAIPWDVLEEASPSGKPSTGDQWRVNFSRVQWRHTVEKGRYKKALNPETNRPWPEDNWVWSPQGIVNMHYPEMWGFVQFAGPKAEKEDVHFEWKDEEYIKWFLRQLYYRQHQHLNRYGSYASRPEALQAEAILNEEKLRSHFNELPNTSIHATSETFEIMLKDPMHDRRWYIREDGKVWNSNDTGEN